MEAYIQRGEATQEDLTNWREGYHRQLHGASASAPIEAKNAKDDPRFAKFFRMIKMHVPREAVDIKMQAEGKDPAILDHPDDPVPESGTSPLARPRWLRKVACFSPACPRAHLRSAPRVAASSLISSHLACVTWYPRRNARQRCPCANVHSPKRGVDTSGISLVEWGRRAFGVIVRVRRGEQQ